MPEAEPSGYTNAKYHEAMRSLSRTVISHARGAPKLALKGHLNLQEPTTTVVEIVYAFVPKGVGALYPCSEDAPVTSGTALYGGKMVLMDPLPYNSCVLMTRSLLDSVTAAKDAQPDPFDPASTVKLGPPNPLDPNGLDSNCVYTYVPGVRFSAGYVSPQGGSLPLAGDQVYVTKQGKDPGVIMYAANANTNPFVAHFSLPGLIPASQAIDGMHPTEAEFASQIVCVTAMLGTVDASNPVTVGAWVNGVKFTEIDCPCQTPFSDGQTYYRGDCVQIATHTYVCLQSGIASGPPSIAAVGKTAWSGNPSGDPKIPSQFTLWQRVPDNFSSQSFGQFTGTPGSTPSRLVFPPAPLPGALDGSYGDGLQASVEAYAGTTASGLSVRMRGQ